MKKFMNCEANLSKLRDLSLFVDDATNLRPDIRAPYVGSASFAHKGGVHADAASKADRSYEHIDPSLVGNRTRGLVSDMSGRSSIMMKAKDMGLDVDSPSLRLVWLRRHLPPPESQIFPLLPLPTKARVMLPRVMLREKVLLLVKPYKSSLPSLFGTLQVLSD